MLSEPDRLSKLWKDICLARYVANHDNPKAFAARLQRRHGAEFVAYLRQLLVDYGRG